MGSLALAWPISGRNGTRRQTVSELLQKISSDEIPSQEHARKCKESALRVVSVLEKEMGPTIRARVMVAGSYGKGTAIASGSDYDIVIFFNEMEPPFTNILKTMETVLKNNSNMFKGFKWKFRSTIHVSFDVDGTQIDIIPAAKLDGDSVCEGSKWSCFTPTSLTSYPTTQYVQTLQKIAELKDPENMSYLYSSSLSIDAVVFVQRQNDFIHAVIRLAKYWARNLNTGRILIRGKSVLVETMAIHACYAVGPVETTGRNLERAFKQFLELFSQAESLRLYVFLTYNREDIPDSVFNQTPLVLDPANPYNNLLNPKNFSTCALKGFQNAAQITLEKLESWKLENSSDISKFRRVFQFP